MAFKASLLLSQDIEISSVPDEGELDLVPTREDVRQTSKVQEEPSSVPFVLEITGSSHRGIASLIEGIRGR